MSQRSMSVSPKNTRRNSVVCDRNRNGRAAAVSLMLRVQGFVKKRLQALATEEFKHDLVFTFQITWSARNYKK